MKRVLLFALAFVAGGAPVAMAQIDPDTPLQIAPTIENSSGSRIVRRTPQPKPQPVAAAPDAAVTADTNPLPAGDPAQKPGTNP